MSLAIAARVCMCSLCGILINKWQTIDLTGYSVASTDGSSMFHFPRKYTLLAGDQVTIWCSPGNKHTTR